MNSPLETQAIGIVTTFLMEQGFTREKAEFAAKDQVERTPTNLLKRLLARDPKAVERMKL